MEKNQRGIYYPRRWFLWLNSTYVQSLIIIWIDLNQKGQQILYTKKASFSLWSNHDKIPWLPNLEQTPWRNGSASDSRSEGCVFKSRRGQLVFLSCPNHIYSKTANKLFVVIDSLKNIHKSFKIFGLTLLERLTTTNHSLARTHYWLTRELLAAGFPLWPVTPLLRQPDPLEFLQGSHVDASLSADANSTWIESNQ